MKITSHKNAFLLISFLLMLAGCTPTREISTDNGLIPPGFADYTGTLLVLESNDFWNPITLTRKMRQAFQKNYTSKFEVVDRKLLAENYSNLDEYRYTIDIFSYITKYTDVGKIQIVDRKTGKIYESPWEALYFQLPKVYAKAMDACRKNKK